jgi:hypothetical protein
MARFKAKEKEIIKKYKLDSFLTSLSEIRECMEELWRVDAPRIVQGYTDHGEEHCERLIKFVDKLLEANKGKKLHPDEMYILLAGIYLHDIGMQCDVVKYPEIKKEAEKLGAQFNINFTADATSVSSAIKCRNDYIV